MKFLFLTIMSAALLITSGCSKNVPVQSQVPVEAIVLSENSIEIFKGETLKLEATILPENASAHQVSWRSSNSEIVSVDASGTITAHDFGKVIITAIAGSIMENCEVNVVSAPIESISIPESITLSIGDTCRITAVTAPENSDAGRLEWNSADTDIAVITSDGTVTGISNGSTLITVHADGIKATCTITVTEVPEFGDFYYSDGTWSTELEQDKTPIGIVFWTGNPSENDKILAEDHPSCTHGLVVALDDISSYWQQHHTFYTTAMPEYEGRISSWVEKNASRGYADLAPDTENKESGFYRIMGYNNTKAIEEFNADVPDYPVNAVKCLDEFRTSVPAPESSSGWYLPSIKEVSLLCSGKADDIMTSDGLGTSTRDAVNIRLGLIEDAVPLDITGWYWASTEYYRTSKYNWDYRFFIGVIHYNEKSETEYVRPVLAF